MRINVYNWPKTDFDINQKKKVHFKFSFNEEDNENSPF